MNTEPIHIKDSLAELERALKRHPSARGKVKTLPAERQLSLLQPERDRRAS